VPRRMLAQQAAPAVPWKPVLRTTLQVLPNPLRRLVVDDVLEFVAQADFLRKALHIQAALTGTDCLAVAPAPEPSQTEEPGQVPISPWAEQQLMAVFGVADEPGPLVEAELAAALDLPAQQVTRWFEEQSAAAQALCKRVRRKKNKRATVGAAHTVVARIGISGAQAQRSQTGVCPRARTKHSRPSERTWM
jgi:hypothetical protein